MNSDTQAFQSASIDLLAKLEAKKAGIQKDYEKRLATVDREIEAVSTTLRLLRHPESIIVEALDLSDSVPMSALKNKSAREALIEIAKRNSGIVRIVDAKDLLIGAGILKSTKNAWGSVYTTLTRSKDFTKIPEPGMFRLIGDQDDLPLQ